MIGNALESKSMYDVDDYQEDQSGQRNIFYPPENECDLVATFAESCQISSEAIAELYSNDGAGPINDLRIQKFLVEALLSTRSRIDLLVKSMQIESKWRLGLSYIPGSNRLSSSRRAYRTGAVIDFAIFCRFHSHSYKKLAGGLLVQQETPT